VSNTQTDKIELVGIDELSLMPREIVPILNLSGHTNRACYAG